MIRATAIRGYRTQSVSVRAVYPVYGRIRNMGMSSGRWITPEDQALKQRVAVMGAKAAEKLFGEIPPEGEEITINGLRFTVIGVLKTKTQISNYNTPDNECIFIPYRDRFAAARHQVSGFHCVDAGQPGFPHGGHAAGARGAGALA